MVCLSEGEMGCVDNLHRCKAECCRFLPFDVMAPPKSPTEYYYKLRGIKIKRINKSLIRVFVPQVCGQLTDDNKCKLHGTGKKPKVCVVYGQLSKHNENHEIPDTCIYKQR